IGIAREHAEDLAEAGLLALQFVDEASADGLLAQQFLGDRLNVLDVTNADQGSGSEQEYHEAEASDQKAEDALARDLLRWHRDFSIAGQACRLLNINRI